MNRRSLIKTGLAGLCIFLSAECLSVSDIAPNREQSSEIKKIEEAKNPNYKIIRDYLKPYCEEYLDFMSPHSNFIRENIEKKGKDAVIQGYVNIQLACLDLALKFKDNEIGEEEYKKLGEILAKHQKDNSEDNPIDCDTDYVKTAYCEWSKYRVNFFKKLLQDKKEDAKSYDKLLKREYTRGEYKKYLQEQAKGVRELYEAFEKSFKGILEAVFGEDEVKIMKQKDIEYNNSTLEKLYGNEEKKSE